jgi:hypothetical protein
MWLLEFGDEPAEAGSMNEHFARDELHHRKLELGEFADPVEQAKILRFAGASWASARTRSHPPLRSRRS